MPKHKYRNPVCVLLWRDASYVYTKKPLKKLPPLQLTAGFVIRANKYFTNIGTNVNYNPKTRQLWPVDGFVIPKKTEVKFKMIGFTDNLNG